MWEIVAANQLSWTVGAKGKGYVLQDGSVHTWNVDDEGNPHHKQEYDRRGILSPLTFLFNVDPNGGINEGGIGYSNRTGKPDQAVISYIADEDPRLHDGITDDEGGFDDDLLDSIYGENPDQDPEYWYDKPIGRDEGFGHAHRLMDILGSTNNDFVGELKEWLKSFQPDDTVSTQHHDNVDQILPQHSVSPRSHDEYTYPPGHEPDWYKQANDEYIREEPLICPECHAPLAQSPLHPDMLQCPDCHFTTDEADAEHYIRTRFDIPTEWQPDPLQQHYNQPSGLRWDDPHNSKRLIARAKEGHTINHIVGQPGRGLVTPEGDVHTWPEDWGTHGAYASAVLGWATPYSSFYIDNDGHPREEGGYRIPPDHRPIVEDVLGPINPPRDVYAAHGGPTKMPEIPQELFEWMQQTEFANPQTKTAMAGVYYHVAPSVLRNSILEHGLLPNPAPRNRAIWMTPNPDEYRRLPHDDLWEVHYPYDDEAHNVGMYDATTSPRRIEPQYLRLHTEGDPGGEFANPQDYQKWYNAQVDSWQQEAPEYSDWYNQQRI